METSQHWEARGEEIKNTCTEKEEKKKEKEKKKLSFLATFSFSGGDLIILFHEH